MCVYSHACHLSSVSQTFPQVRALRYSAAIVISVTDEAEIQAIFADTPQDVVVGVEEHPIYPGNLVFQPHDSVRQTFYTTYSDWLSRFLTLNDLYLLGPFTERLAADGYALVFMPSCESILTDYERWSSPIDIAGFTCPGEGELYGFQQFGLRRALERAEGSETADRLFFVNWSAGAGKSLFACAGAQELVNRGLVDVVLAVTTAPLKTNLCRFFINTTTLDAVMVEGGPAKRKAKYREDHQVWVLNYDRFRNDYESINALAEFRRVLFVFDEVQKILTEKGPTLTRKAVNEVVSHTTPTIWAMSASVVRASPLRWRDIFSLDGHPRQNPLGSKTDFERRYVLSRKSFPIKTKSGGYFDIEKLTWNLPRLHEVRHRISDRVHAIRKTDPDIRDTFKDMRSIVTPVQLSREDGRLYDAVVERADVARKQEEGLGLAQYAQLLRHICNNPLALRRTDIEFGHELVLRYPNLITSQNCNKIAMLIDQLEAIRDASDKAVVFSQWVKTSLLIIAAELDRRGISYVVHHGQQTRIAAQTAQDQFRRDDAITVFLSSDAGAYGLNLPEARAVINYEQSFSWDTMMQRAERINRADSQLDGLTSWTMITDDTIEVEIAKVCEERRQLAATTMGTIETLDTGIDESPELLERLIFGGRE